MFKFFLINNFCTVICQKLTFIEKNRADQPSKKPIYVHFYKDWNVYKVNNYGRYKIYLSSGYLQPIFLHCTRVDLKKKN